VGYFAENRLGLHFIPYVVFMFRVIPILVVMLLLLPTPVFAEAGVSDSDDVLRLGVFPRRSTELTMKIYTPLVQYLSRTLGREVRLVTAKNFEIFWQDVVHQKFDIVHYNQYHYVKSNKYHGYSVIVKNEELGEDTIAGSLVVRKDSGINSVEDLRGKKIIFGGSRSAMLSYIAATHLLRKAGLARGDYIELFAPNPPNAIFAAFYGQVAAGGTGEKALKLPVVSKRIDISKMKYLVLGRQLAHLPWAVSQRVSPELKAKIKSILVDLKTSDEGKAVLAKSRLTGLNAASDEDYDEHRKIIWDVRQENYCVRDCDYVNTPGNNENANGPLHLAVFPRRAESVTRELFNPLSEYLAQELQQSVHLHTSKNFATFWQGVVREHYDVVHFNQYQYVKSHKLYGYEVIVLNEETNSTQIIPAIAVRKSAGITTIKDLIGKSIMFGGDRAAMVSYIAATKVLRDGGLGAGDYTERFTLIPANSCKAVLLGQTEACGVSTKFFMNPHLAKKLDISSLRILAQGAPLPQLVWAVRSNIDPMQKEKIQQLLIKLKGSPSGRAVLNNALLTGFQATTDEEFDIPRKIISEIVHEQY